MQVQKQMKVQTDLCLTRESKTELWSGESLSAEHIQTGFDDQPHTHAAQSQPEMQSLDRTDLHRDVTTSAQASANCIDVVFINSEHHWIASVRLNGSETVLTRIWDRPRIDPSTWVSVSELELFDLTEASSLHRSVLSKDPLGIYRHSVLYCCACCAMHCAVLYCTILLFISLL